MHVIVALLHLALQLYVILCINASYFKRNTFPEHVLFHLLSYISTNKVLHQQYATYRTYVLVYKSIKVVFYVLFALAAYYSCLHLI